MDDDDLSIRSSNSLSTFNSNSTDNSATNALLLYLGYEIFITRDSKPGNKFIDNNNAWEFVLSWDEAMFFRQFRLSKNNFNDLCFKLKNNYKGRYEDGWKNYQLSITREKASCQGSFISLEIKLCITLRLMAGASYLDMVWYGVSVNNVFKIFFSTLKIIKKVEHSNISWPSTEEAFRKLSDEWSKINIDKRGFDLMPGTIAAGDGIAVKTIKPTDEDRGNIPLSAFKNRKGYFALIVQAFCDAFCKFLSFEVGWPGATPDVTCHLQSRLYKWIILGNFPSWAHMVLDEAYTSIGGGYIYIYL
jgi:hypothetical protein